MTATGSDRRARPLAVRAIALTLVMVVACFSVEVVWERGDGLKRIASSAAIDAQPDAGEDGCPCFCACACEAVHVVLPAATEPAVECDVSVFTTESTAFAPEGRTIEPEFRPPRVHS